MDSNNNNNSNKVNYIKQHAFQGFSQCHMCIPPRQTMEFHPSLLPFTLHERNQAAWCHSHCPHHLHYTTPVLPHPSHHYVNMVVTKPCRDPDFCHCLGTKFNQHASCVGSNHPKPNFHPGITPLSISSWYSTINADISHQGTFLPKNGQLSPKPLHPPLERQDTKLEVTSKEMNYNVLTSQIESDVGKTSETELEISNEEEAPKEDKQNELCTISIKKRKIATTDQDHLMCNKKINSGKAISKETKMKQKIVLETKECLSKNALEEDIKKEMNDPKAIDSNKKDLCNDEKVEIKTMGMQGNVPFTATAKCEQQPKSKKRTKDGTQKPYNTRMVTSRPQTYHSDFVMPNEEAEWKEDKESFHVKGRQRSKLNRLLANEHERRRVAQLNSAYQDLRQLIPGYQCDTKLPKIKILKYAINYIAHLDDILERV